MTGHKNFNKLREQVRSNPARRARVEEHKRAIDAALALAELRRDQEMTQSDMAAVLGVSQVNISRIERANDVYLSTLKSYVEALGGQLEVRAVFPERAVRLAYPGTAPSTSLVSGTGKTFFALSNRCVALERQTSEALANWLNEGFAQTLRDLMVTLREALKHEWPTPQPIKLSSDEKTSLLEALESWRCSAKPEWRERMRAEIHELEDALAADVHG
jgi:transcriptional regulator with XRE-family HTH domain